MRYEECLNLVKENNHKLNLKNLKEVAYKIAEFEINLENLLKDIYSDKTQYPTVTVNKWCFKNEIQISASCKRWISNQAKFISEYLGFKYFVKGQIINNQKYPATEFHPKIIEFLKLQYDASYKQKMIVEIFAKLMKMKQNN